MNEMEIGSSVGPRLKFRRKEVGITLKQLSEKTGLTASFLSQVERGVVNVSWRSLQIIAEALEVPYLYFLAENKTFAKETTKEKLSISREKTNQKLPRYSHVVRGHARPKLSLHNPDITYELLVPSMNQKMVAFLGKVAPGTNNIARRLRKPTEEFIFVFSGEVKIVLDSDDYILKAGDSIYFEGESLQGVYCVSEDEDVVMISVITPAVF